VDTRLVGRDIELAALVGALDTVSRDSGRLLLLSGEAGIGKTRLVAEVLVRAGERGFTLLKSRAHALHAGLAYAPIVDALRPHVGKNADLTDLGRLFGGQGFPAPSQLGAPELEKIRLFEAVAQLVGRLSRSAPVLLFVDDLHWADHGTIELLHYLGRRTLVLATYRAGEVSGALGELVTSVRRENPGDEIALAPLTDDAVAELTRDLLDEAPPPEVLRQVTARAKGVPLFVTALAHNGSLAPGAVPAIVRDVVLGRLQRLGEPERRVLEIIAVAGESATDDVLRAVWDDDPRLTLRSLRASRLISEDAVAYRVTHPLYAEVAYAELTLGERRELHASIAEAIDRFAPTDVLALAPHYLAAGELVDVERAAEILTDAGWRAQMVDAGEEAVRYLSAALDLTGDRGLPTALLLGNLGRAQLVCGRSDETVATWKRAAAIAERIGAPTAVAAAHYALATLESERGNVALAEEHWQLGAELVPDDDVSVVEHIGLRTLYTITYGDDSQVRAIAGKLAAFAADPSPAAQVATHVGRGLLAYADDDFATARAEAEQAVIHAEQDPEHVPTLLSYTRRALVGLTVLAGQLDSAVDSARLNCGEHIDQGLAYGRVVAMRRLSLACHLAGDPQTALDEIDVAIAAALRLGVPRPLARALLGQAFVLAEHGRLAEAARCVDEAKRIYPTWDVTARRAADLVETVLALYRGLPGEAPQLVDWELFHDPLLACLEFVYSGQAAVAAEDHDTASRIIERLRGFGRTAPFPDALADRIEGLQNSDAVQLLTAADRLEGMGARLLSAQARLESAELTGDKQAVLACLTAFDEAGTAPWADRARKAARSLGLRLAAPRGSGPLSKREAQVTALVGEGLSNADIAKRLFLSERTVETHLRNTYAKLPVTSRIALARWASENTP
jgi:DNA-binding CsgD family transcriptional regulator/tetratricopeptide (TPR) repeat protein